MVRYEDFSFHDSFLSVMWTMCLHVDFYEFHGLCMMNCDGCRLVHVLHVLDLEELVKKGCALVVHSKCLMICFNE